MAHVRVSKGRCKVIGEGLLKCYSGLWVRKGLLQGYLGVVGLCRGC